MGERLQPLGNNRKKRSLGECLVMIPLFSVGICMFLLAIFGDRIPKEDRVPASAVITGIGSRYNNHVRKFNVFVRYTVDGLEFESRMGDYFYGMQVGDVVKIYYDRNHPFNIQLAGLTYHQLWMLPVILMYGYWELRLIGTVRTSLKNISAKKKRRVPYDESAYPSEIEKR